MFRAAAEISASERLRKLYGETADVLTAMEKAYNDLHAAADLAVQKGNLAPLRAHLGKVEAMRKKMEERSGGA